MLQPRFDSEKALEAILYVATRAPIPDMYHVGKILYFADIMHLDCYGRLITGDNYIAMKDGPVAQNGYDIIKIAQGKGKFIPNGITIDDVMGSLRVSDKSGGYRVEALRSFDDDAFSDSDLKCIDNAIDIYGEMTFGQIRDISHDEVWSGATENCEIPLESIVTKCKNSKELLAYLSGN